MNCLLGFVLILLVDSFEGQQYNIQETPRLKQFDDKDVTTVLLVDSRGRSSFGRYQNVKPDIGLITSTARTFIQDGITTEYATQVLGTTLDNGRLYAHLLSKSSRVLYDDGSQSKSYESNNNNKKWNVKESSLNTKPFINSIDFVLPNVLVDEKKEESGNVQQVTPKSQEEEILKEESSNNFRVPYDNVKVFKITPEVADLTQENVIIHKESKEKFIPSKVRPWDELPTFTVRNEFSPSGLSFLGDIPEFEQRTERSKLTTPAERKAKFLLKAGLTKPNARELTSITYTGFADFTTTVGDTVIIFSPHTTQPVNMVKESKRLPKIESTINPTTTLLEPPLMTKVLTYLSQEPPMETKTFKGPDLDMKTTIATMVIDKTDRIRDPKSQLADEKVNMDAKSAVLAHEQGQETVTFSPDVIQASETQIPMLSTPSDEDIAKIFASLKALEQKSTVEETTSSTGGKTTIFFDDEPIQTTSTKHSQVEETITATTESEELLTTANEITTTENEEEIVTEDAECTGSVQIVPTTTYKTLTYLTTFFIPNESSTSTSVRSNLVVSSELGLQTKSCQMGTTTESIITTEQNVETTTETETEKPTTEQEILTTTKQIETTTSEITTEEYHVTESEAETTEATTEDGDELEIIYKTLYTTYTYLTTYFQESSTSIASRTIVTTNVVSSTLDPNAQSSVDSVEGIMDMEESTSKYKTKTVTFDDFANITPTSVNPIKATSTDSSTDWLDSESGTQDSSKATPGLDDSKILAEGVKTYYTTYTYFTTIFVDGETEISSRTEVYTNYVTPSGVQQEILNTQSPDDSDDYVAKKIKLLSKIKPGTTYNTINRHKQEEAVTTTESNEINDTLDLSEYETISTMVTDVRSSTSEGDRRIIDNVGKRNVLLDDQVFSESNNESEITPHPTLLLQTSYTTFTYFTTMYQGTTSSNVVSRLETVTNVVTQTLEPKEMKEVSSTEDPNAPVTYFTTFTYWTTLYKEGTTKITSREETVTNVETASIKATSTVPFIEKTAVHNLETSMEEDSESSKPQTVGDDELTTYFTTYTYYTTSYIGNSTVLNSRLETVTNVINNTADIDTNYIGRAIGSNDKNKVDITSTIKPTGLISTILNTIENNGTTTLLSTDVYGTYIDGLYAKVLESTSSILTTQINASKIQASETLKPTGVVSINKGKIVDAEGVSTLFYQTQAIGTYIDNLYAQVIESTSSLAIDEAKKSALPADLPVVHRTGLVRHIEGSIVQNKTTTFYESNVLGTFIDGRYAQVIQSTSSFLTEAAASITPASTLSADKAIPNTQLVTTSPSPVAIEGSFNENKDEESDESDDDEDDNDDKSKSRLTFQSKKRTFTPAIRPFASRQRPSFAPKRKQLGQGTAATITRSDFTPTVTAVPASSKTNRFGGRRSSSSINPSSTSRRFSRTKSSTTSGFNRRGSSSRIQPSSTLNSSSRRSGFRTSSAAGALNRSSRLRIRPTLASGLLRSPSSKAVTETPPEDENNLTTLVTEEPNEEGGETTLDVQGTTEASTRRSQNPLLKFRRPPLTRPSATRTTKSGKSATTPATTTTSTTSRPRTTRANSLLNRSRSNALFPRRGLFTTTTTAAPEEEEIVEDNEDLVEEEEDDTDYDSSLRNTQTVNPPTTTSTTEKPVTKNRGVQIKPFFRRRSKRATYSRFRRPTTTTTQSTIEEETEEVTHKPKRSRYNKNRGSTTTTTTTTSSPRKRIIPSKVSSSSRTQFTLRDTGFKRPTSSKSSTSRSRSASTRNTNSRYSKRVPTSYQSETTRKTTTNNRQSSRTSSRGRQRQQSDPENDNQVKQKFDGTITVTRQIPTEVTIPVVNGKVTEYKNIVTAKYSTEVLNPNQYTTSVNALGKGVTILLSENTDIINGATLITQYVLKETPTSSVVFTPTYINRRKTSFSHVIPSTIYEVEPVVNTIQPLAAQAPLANILLSQLLLGGIQQQPNPALLGLQQIHQQPGLVPITPTTELKTRTTTYVTTVTSETSTIVPLTFRGKEILTTIIDTNVMVVTATEFLTDTVTVTPTLGYQPQQLNTALLLPLLQQQLQQQQAQQIPAGLLNLNSNEHVNYQEPEKFNLAEVEEEEVIEEQVVNSRQRKPKKNKPVETSVITLYVSGRTPGEFTTVLSTVVAENANRNRRNVKTESISTPQLILNTEESAFDNSIALESSEVVKETESLESIIGDVSKHFAATKQTRSSDDFLA